MAQDNQNNQGFAIPPATPPTITTPPSTTETKVVNQDDLSFPPDTESDTSSQAYAIAGVILLIWVVAAFLFRRKWAISLKERRVSESNAETSGWAFFGALTSLGVGAAAAFFDTFSSLLYLGSIVGVAIILFGLAFFVSRK